MHRHIHRLATATTLILAILHLHNGEQHTGDVRLSKKTISVRVPATLPDGTVVEHKLEFDRADVAAITFDTQPEE